MKNAVLIFSTILLTNTVFCQKVPASAVPKEVLSAFAKKHPEAKGVKWEKEDANYEAEFKLATKEYSSVFDQKGNFLETEMEIPVSKLPTAVVSYLNAKYAGQKIKEAAQITDAKGIVTYEAELNGKDLLFDSKGNFIK